MAPKSFLGEFELMVLLAILQCGDEANGYEVRRELEESAGRTVSKGAFYTTLDRLEGKGYLSWEARVPAGSSGSLPRRHFEVSAEGLAELQKSRSALLRLWRNLDGVLEG